jgi:porin
MSIVRSLVLDGSCASKSSSFFRSKQKKNGRRNSSKTEKVETKTGVTAMKRCTSIATVLFLLGICLGTRVRAQDTSAASNPYSGDLLSRSTLTGDWWGVRNQLAEKGVTFDLSITQVGQGVVNGGKSGVWEYGGRGDIVFNADSQKLGLWPGGFLNMEAEGNWASSVNQNTGALMPVNTSQTLPLPGQNFDLIALNFTQFLSPYAGLTIGKYATITSTSGDMNEFAHGKGDTQFMNMALNFNPLIVFTVPYSALGTGVIVLPTKDPGEAIVNLLVLSANGQPNTSGFNDLNGNDIVVVGEGRVRTNFFGLTGHQDFGTSFSNKKFTSIDQRLDRDVIENGALRAEKGSWNIWYNFDQYLYEPKKGVDRGVGVFGRLGVSDGNPNFMKFFGSFGVGGKGMFESRPFDQFGLGYYYININSPTVQGLLQTRDFLRNEYGFEAFYNVALTRWALLTPDIQVVRGAQRDILSIVQGPLGMLPRIDKTSIGTATVLGLRLQLLF